ncbi:hypothetical protein KZ770_18760 [Escherichia coli]|nr:hypothetical protein [Escherichia coli]
MLLASPLFEKAKAAVNERAKIVEEIRQALLKQENTSDEQITKAREDFKDNSFIKMQVGAKTAILKVIINGEYHELAEGTVWIIAIATVENILVSTILKATCSSELPSRL